MINLTSGDYLSKYFSWSNNLKATLLKNLVNDWPRLTKVCTCDLEKCQIQIFKSIASFQYLMAWMIYTNAQLCVFLKTMSWRIFLWSIAKFHHLMVAYSPLFFCCQCAWKLMSNSFYDQCHPFSYLHSIKNLVALYWSRSWLNACKDYWD